MAVILIHTKVTAEDLAIAQEEYGEYIKVVVDVVMGKMGIGGLWHADIEQELLKSGSIQKNLWGGGIETKTHKIDFTSRINIRPVINASMEILDPQIKQLFSNVVSKKFQL